MIDFKHKKTILTFMRMKIDTDPPPENFEILSDTIVKLIEFLEGCMDDFGQMQQDMVNT